MLRTIRKRQFQFPGHIMRKNQMENMRTGKLEGKQSRGRLGQTYISSLSKVLAVSKLDMMKATRDRGLWKTIIANILAGHGT